MPATRSSKRNKRAAPVPPAHVETIKERTPSNEKQEEEKEPPQAEPEVTNVVEAVEDVVDKMTGIEESAEKQESKLTMEERKAKIAQLRQKMVSDSRSPMTTMLISS